MMRCCLSASVLILLLSAVSADARAQHTHEAARDMPAFAASLMSERDYYRAIGVYKYIAFSTTDTEVWRECQWQIARAYRMSSRLEHAIHTLTRLRNASSESPSWRDRVALGLGASYLGMRLPQVADPFLEQISDARVPELALLHALSELQRGELDEADRRLRSIPDAAPVLAPNALRLQAALEAARVAPRRQPWLAGLLSAIVPGAGQLYAGHPVDALQAFVFVSAFGFTSYVAYRYDQQQGNPYLLTGAALLVTTFFYGANVVGAIRTAVYHEQRIHEALLAATEREIGNLTLEPAGPRK